MYIKNINFPEQLIDSIKAGSLVVFAGAGVSVNSGLPLFEKLGEEIIQEAQADLERKREGRHREPVDVWLGRAVDKEIDVHRIALEILTRSNPEPNTLHYELLKLFSKPDSLRLVTTNFDNMFTLAANEVFDTLPEIYYAPALPTGSDFNGIIHLHSSVEKPAKRLILADRDFARAYLVEGWARRFLLGVFQTYDVLFVGYSHSEFTMQYLARGLPVEQVKVRYALVDQKKDKETDWDAFKIKTIPYRAGTKHAALIKALPGLVERIKMPAIEREQEIKNIVSKPPSPDPEIQGVIDDALRATATTRFFTEHAKPELLEKYNQAIAWLHWVEQKPEFKLLFDQYAPLGGFSIAVDKLLLPDIKVGREVSTQLANWFAENFVCQYPDDAMLLIERQGGMLNPVLWRFIAGRIERVEPRPEPKIISAWIAILLLSVPVDSMNRLEYLLMKCRYPEDGQSAVLLFEYLSKPQLKLKKGLRWDEATGNVSDKPDFEVKPRGDDHWLEKAWKEIFKPNIDQFAERLEPIIVNHLHQAHVLLSSATGTDARLDLSRGAIEPHGQNKHHDLNILIDAVRDVLEWMLVKKQAKAGALIEDWTNCDMQVFRRLAIHGVTKNAALTPDEKLDWLIRHELLFVYGLKHETFQLLKNAFPQATEEGRMRMLDTVEHEATNENDQEIRAYEKHNLLVWFNQVAPDDQPTKQRLEAMQQANPELPPRAHPDFDRWIGEARRIDPHELISPKELTEKDPANAEVLDWLMSFKAEGSVWHDREDFLANVSEAVVLSHDWGMRLAKALEDKQAWDCDLWGSLFLGWQKSVKTEEQIDTLLNLLIKRSQLCVHSHALADFLDKLIEAQPEDFPLPRLTLAESLADKLWDFHANDAEAPEDADDWLLKAINNPGGKLALFWLHALSMRNKRTSGVDSGLPANFKQYFNKIVGGQSIWAELGRVVLASQAHFLFAVDAEWTQASILPLFNWSNLRQSKQAWHGWLTWGHLSNPLLPGLLPLYLRTSEHLSVELASMRDRFMEHTAIIAVYWLPDPLNEGWLTKCLKAVEDKDRQNWARHVAFLLSKLDLEQITDLWQRWLRKYWAARVRGISGKPTPRESAAMVEWSAHLGPVFDEAVDYICESPKPEFQYTGRPEFAYTDIFRRFIEREFPQTQSKPLTKLLLFLLPDNNLTINHCNDLERLVEALIETGDASRDDLYKLCNNLADMGCSQASSLSKKLSN